MKFATILIALLLVSQNVLSRRNLVITSPIIRKMNTHNHLIATRSPRRTWHTGGGNGMFMKRQPKPLINTLSSSSPKARDDAPGAYSWGYRWTDEFGTQMFREENADGRGTVWGRYSFRENNGRLRIVEYISDANGFRTKIRTNEEGVVTSNPANAQIVRFDDENDIPAKRMQIQKWWLP